MKKFTAIFTAVLLLLLSLPFGVNVKAAEFSLQAAIDAASPGDTINIPRDRYYIEEQIVIDKPNLTINGDWAFLVFDTPPSDGIAIHIKSGAEGLVINDLQIWAVAADNAAVKVEALDCRFDNVLIDGSACAAIVSGGSAVFDNCGLLGRNSVIAGKNYGMAYIKNSNIDAYSDSAIHLSDGAYFIISECEIRSDRAGLKLLSYTDTDVTAKFIRCKLQSQADFNNPVLPLEGAQGTYSVIAVNGITGGVFSEDVPTLTDEEAQWAEEAIISDMGKAATPSDLQPEPEPEPEPQPQPGYGGGSSDNTPSAPSVPEITTPTVYTNAEVNEDHSINSAKTVKAIETAAKLAEMYNSAEIVVYVNDDEAYATEATIKKLRSAAGDYSLTLVFSSGLSVTIYENTRAIYSKITENPEGGEELSDYIEDKLGGEVIDQIELDEDNGWVDFGEQTDTENTESPQEEIILPTEIALEDPEPPKPEGQIEILKPNPEEQIEILKPNPNEGAETPEPDREEEIEIIKEDPVTIRRETISWREWELINDDYYDYYALGFDAAANQWYRSPVTFDNGVASFKTYRSGIFTIAGFEAE
jgi:hypothetical protein